MRSIAPASRALRALALAPPILFGAYACVLAFDLGAAGLEDFFSTWVYNFLIAAAALLCVTRAVAVPAERIVWLLVGLALTCWTASELHFELFLADEEFTPYPSVGDWLFLAFYPLVYAAFVLLARLRIREFQSSLWLDGLIAALGVASVTAALVARFITLDGSDTLGSAVNLAYSLGDVILLSLVVGVFSLTAWRPGRPWALLGIGLALVAVADIAFFVLSAEDVYFEGSLVDLLWPAAMLTIGYGAWQAIPPRRDIRLDGARLFLVPCLVALLALAVLAVSSFGELDPVAPILATATLALVILRLAVTLAENQRRLATSRREAHTDALTRLGNRRRLAHDLEEELELAVRDSQGALLLFDLDGFKGFNDRFGHPAGDALLARLGDALRKAMRDGARAYRLGGDEFCVLIPAGSPDFAKIEHAATQALRERGDDYSVAASSGKVIFPAEGATFAQVMSVADARLYTDKAQRRPLPDRAA
ncbi:MAG TPA: GGDEF domain-containing protein [Thermoleophilaceae bacterium]|nr:GGDEF domain-containing protein [Actinomycetota bacterium]HYN50690.1 GGDEF domain-containing protein [Thermoleophilaceae bacterium]